MNVAFVATAVAVISLHLTWTTLAAPTTQWKADSPLRNDLEIFKSFISEVLIQQKEAQHLKDKEMVATSCKLMIMYLNKLKEFALKEKLFEDGSEEEYCQNFELPPRPRPEDKSAILNNLYQTLFSIMKRSGIGDIYKKYGDILKRLAG